MRKSRKVQFQILQALIDALQGDVQAADARLQKARNSLAPNDLEDLRALIPMVKSARDAFSKPDADLNQLGGAAILHMPKLLPHLKRLVPQAAPVPDENELTKALPLMRTPPILHRVFDQYRAAFLSFAGDKFNEQMIQESARRLALHSDGMLWLLHGHLCFMHAQRFMQPNADGEAYQRLLREAIRAYELAAQKPSLFPARAPALEALVMQEGLLGSPKRTAPDLEMRKRAVTHLRKRVAMPAELPAPWLGAYVKVALNAGDVTLARVILDEQGRRAPGDRGVAKERSRFELEQGAYGAAIRLAQQVLADRFDDAEMKQLLRDAADKMREEARKLEQPPR